MILQPGALDRRRVELSALGAYHSMINACANGDLDTAAFWLKQMNTHLDRLSILLSKIGTLDAA